MWPEDMPTPGTRQWGQWFNQQDPQTQQQIIFDFGLGDANQPIAGNSVGGFQPEINQQGFGLLDQLSPPPVINSKGVIQPSGTEQVQKQTNLFQDQLSLGTDNMLAAIAGQFAPTAFTPSYEPQGNPVTPTGLRQLQSLANTGGWEGFMASQMLPKDYGGGGMSASQAKGALLKAVMTPDDADEGALQLREELRGSLTPRYETQGESANPTVKPINKDLSTAQGVANSFDLSDVDEVSRGWQKELANDPVAGYTDPVTGLSYLGAKEKKTPTMEWFDKYGLPYANKQYSDPDQIASMQDAVAPWQYRGQGMEEDFARQDALAANQKARDELGGAQSQMDILEKAYNQATKAGLWPEHQVVDKEAYNPNNPMQGATVVPDRSVNMPGPIINGMGMQPGGLYAPPVNYEVVKQQIEDAKAKGQPSTPMKTIPAHWYMDIDKQGNPTRLSINQTQPSGQTWSTEHTNKNGVQETKLRPGVKMDAGLTADTNFDFGAPGAVVPGTIEGMDNNLLSKLIPGLDMLTSKRKVFTAADLVPAKQRVEMARKAAAATVPGIQAASNSSETSMQRQLARARMMGLASTGRTPLSDTLAGRMMAARTAGIYR